MRIYNNILVGVAKGERISILFTLVSAKGKISCTRRAMHPQHHSRLPRVIGITNRVTQAANKLIGHLSPLQRRLGRQEAAPGILSGEHTG